MKISVTAEDIQQSSRCDPDGCPIGRALSRAGVEHFGVVGSSVLVADEQHGAQTLSLPPQVRSWLLAYDCYQPVEPITFELDLKSSLPFPELTGANRT